jgi:outer membrane cobalamin receptor
MRILRTITTLLMISLCAVLSFATPNGSKYKLRVIDPSSAAVAGARVELYGVDSRLIAVTLTPSDGTVSLPDVVQGTRLQIEAAGFRPYVQTLNETSGPLLQVQLQLASAAETVVVTAAATPLEAEKTGVSIASLDSTTLGVLNLPELSDNLRFVPGTYISDSGQRGGLTSLFVRGGESNYNKVIVDGVPVNEDGGSINLGVVSAFQVDRVEMVRGAASTLYGSDAMTSVTQLWSGSGTTHVPELKFGSEGGTFSTAHGFGSFAGTASLLDYNVFADESHTNGQGVNDGYENAMQGANVGMKLSNSSALRLRLRHSNSRTGLQSDWYYPFPAAISLSPDTYQYARQNDFLGSVALIFAPTRNWLNTVTGFEYNHRLRNMDPGLDVTRLNDYPFDSRDHFNRAGVDYQGEVTERAWSRSVFGFHFEDENGYISSAYSSYGYPGTSFTHGLRRNSAIYGEQVIDWKRLTMQAGLRWEHNETFGDKAVPRASASYLLLRGGNSLSGTRLHGSYSEGIKEPSFEESFGIGGTYLTLPNPNLKPEQVRALETGLVQSLFNNRWSLSVLYFNNRFSNQIEYSFNDTTFTSQYINLNRTLAHGAEVELQGRVSRKLSIGGSYTYTSAQALDAPQCTAGSGCTLTGQALIRRPKQLGTVLTTYKGSHWGASLAGSFVGRRTDFDFEEFPVTLLSLPGYARLDASGYRDINRHVTAFATVQNLLNRKYEDVAGYPAYKANFRAGLRFRFGGE